MKKVSLHLFIFFTFCLFNRSLLAQQSEQDFNITQAVTVVFSQKGFNGIKNDIIPLFSNNGIELSHINIKEMTIKTPVTPTEKFSSNPAWQKTIAEIKDVFKDFILGVVIKSHEFKIDLDNLALDADWSNIEFKVHPFGQDVQPVSELTPELNTTLFKADLVLVANNITFNLNSLRLNDLQNSWLHEWGINQLLLTTDVRKIMDKNLAIIRAFGFTGSANFENINNYVPPTDNLVAETAKQKLIELFKKDIFEKNLKILRDAGFTQAPTEQNINNFASVANYERVELAKGKLIDLLKDGFIYNSSRSEQVKVPLSIKIPLRFYKKADDLLGVEVENVETNLEQIKLLLDFTSLQLPNIELKIDNTSLKINQAALEAKLQNPKSGIIQRLQESIDKHAQETIPSLIKSYVDRIATGSVKEVNQIMPPGSPENSPLMLWGIMLKQITVDAGLFALQFNGLVHDPVTAAPPVSLPFPTGASAPVANLHLNRHNPAFDKYDVTFAFKTEFFNKFIDVGFKRGFIKGFETDTKNPVTLVESPYIFIGKKVNDTNDTSNKIKMKVKLDYGVLASGQKMAVKGKNTIRITLDLILKTEIDPSTKKVKLVIVDIDPNSVEVDPNSFNWIGKLGSGVQKTKNTVNSEETRKGLRGKVLAEDLSVPTDLLGLKLTQLETGFDESGYLLFHSNYE